MRYLIIVICLALTSCGTADHGSRHKKNQDAEFKAAIQHVLDARTNIRTIISHPPRTVEELNEIANMNPNAMLFLAQEFAQRLQTIPVEDCPRDFREAFANYVTAWNERAATSPNLLILIQPAAPSQGESIQNRYVEQTESTWNALKTVCTKYDVTAE